MAVRKIVKIGEERCDGCGLCIPQCAEGAIQIIDGKARLVQEKFSDGLGACLGHCPQDAITIEEKKAEDFDEHAVHEYLVRLGKAPEGHSPSETRDHSAGCPSARVLHLKKEGKPLFEDSHQRGKTPSMVGQWPIQLKLVSPTAPFFQEANILIVADCVPFAYADFYRDFLREKAVVVGCPKLDDPGFYVEKLSRILSDSSVKSITVAHMEVPCCFGLNTIVQEALKKSGKSIPVEEITITIDWEKKEERYRKIGGLR